MHGSRERPFPPRGLVAASCLAEDGYLFFRFFELCFKLCHAHKIVTSLFDRHKALR